MVSCFLGLCSSTLHLVSAGPMEFAVLSAVWPHVLLESVQVPLSEVGHASAVALTFRSSSVLVRLEFASDPVGSLDCESPRPETNLLAQDDLQNAPIIIDFRLSQLQLWLNGLGLIE